MQYGKRLGELPYILKMDQETGLENSELFLLLYADNTVIIGESQKELQTTINVLYEYSNREQFINKYNLNKGHSLPVQKETFETYLNLNMEPMIYKLCLNICALGVKLLAGTLAPSVEIFRWRQWYPAW